MEDARGVLHMSMVGAVGRASRASSAALRPPSAAPCPPPNRPFATHGGLGHVCTRRKSLRGQRVSKVVSSQPFSTPERRNRSPGPPWVEKGGRIGVKEPPSAAGAQRSLSLRPIRPPHPG